MNIRAKMQVAYKNKSQWNAANWQVRLQAVTDGSEENKKFFAATPSGYVEVWVNEAVADQFQEGAEYYIDFVPASSEKE